MPRTGSVNVTCRDEVTLGAGVGTGEGRGEEEGAASFFLVSLVVCWLAVESEQPLLSRREAVDTVPNVPNVPKPRSTSVERSRSRTWTRAVRLKKSVMNTVINTVIPVTHGFLKGVGGRCRQTSLDL
jgi:hypothetical protein